MTATEQIILDQIARTRADVLMLQAQFAAFIAARGLTTDLNFVQQTTATLHDAVTEQMTKVLKVLLEERRPEIPQQSSSPD